MITPRYGHTKYNMSLPEISVRCPADLIGHTSLLYQREDEQKFRAMIVEAVKTHVYKVKNGPELLKFKHFMNNDQFEDVLTYNDIVQLITTNQEFDIV